MESVQEAGAPVALRAIPAPWDNNRGGTAATATASSSDVRLQDPESSTRSGRAGGPRDQRIHGPTPCCPSCGFTLPPTIAGGGLLGRTPSVSSIISGIFSPGSSLRGGTTHGGSVRAGSLLNLALLSGGNSSNHKYEAVGDEGEPSEERASGPDLNGIVRAPSLTFPEEDPPTTTAAPSTLDDADIEAAQPPLDAGSGGRVLPASADAAPAMAGDDKPPAKSRVAQYLGKARGVPGKRPPPRHSVVEALWSFVGALIGISAVAALDQYLAPELDTLLLAASFGASAVLVYSAPASPLAQPLNLVVGTILSALTGVITRVIFQGQVTFLAAGTAVAAAIFVMGVTGTTHPPGGAISLIAVIGGKRVFDMGFWFVLFPGTIGPLVLLLVAVVVNNLNPARSYPLWWY